MIISYNLKSKIGSILTRREILNQILSYFDFEKNILSIINF